MPLAVSVVVAVQNEEGAVNDVVSELKSVFDEGLGADGYELIFVDDKSSDATVSRLRELQKNVPNLRIIQHEKNVGKSGGVRTGIMHARTNIIAMMDGDGQNPAADVLRTAKALLNAGPEVGLVAGQRKKRQDTASKKWASRWANGIRKRMLNDGAEDTGCGIKAIRRDVFLRLPYFDNMHRYIPALVNREGYKTLFEMVEDRLRTTGHSKYTNIGRLWVALSDLPGVMWLNRRYRHPGSTTEL